MGLNNTTPLVTPGGQHLRSPNPWRLPGPTTWGARTERRQVLTQREGLAVIDSADVIDSAHVAGINSSPRVRHVVKW